MPEPSIPFPAGSDWLQRYVGQQVVADLHEFYLIIGKLDAISANHLSFIEADLHDHREANSTKEIYVLETQKFGVRINRMRVDVPRSQLVAISRMDDVTA